MSNAEIKNTVEGNTITTSIAPWLSVKDSIKAVGFYKNAFGATEAYRLEVDEGVIAKLSVDGAAFWVSPESADQGNLSPGALGGVSVRMIFVADPDTFFSRALNAGAIEVFPVSEEHGWRVGRLVDIFGHQWEIGRQTE